MRPGEEAYDISPMISKKGKKEKLSFSYKSFLLSVSRKGPSVCTCTCTREYAPCQPPTQAESVNCNGPGLEVRQTLLAGCLVNTHYLCSLGNGVPALLGRQCIRLEGSVPAYLAKLGSGQ